MTRAATLLVILVISCVLAGCCVCSGKIYSELRCMRATIRRLEEERQTNHCPPSLRESNPPHSGHIDDHDGYTDHDYMTVSQHTREKLAEVMLVTTDLSWYKKMVIMHHNILASVHPTEIETLHYPPDTSTFPYMDHIL